MSYNLTKGKFSYIADLIFTFLGTNILENRFGNPMNSNEIII